MPENLTGGSTEFSLRFSPPTDHFYVKNDAAVTSKYVTAAHGNTYVREPPLLQPVALVVFSAWGKFRLCSTAPQLGQTDFVLKSLVGIFDVLT